MDRQGDSVIPRGLQPEEAEPRSLITGPSACKTLNSYNTQPSASTALRAQVRSGAPSQGRVQFPRSRSAGASEPRPGLELGSAAQRPLPAPLSAAHAGRNRDAARMLTRKQGQPRSRLSWAWKTSFCRHKTKEGNSSNES